MSRGVLQTARTGAQLQSTDVSGDAEVCKTLQITSAVINSKAANK